MNTTSLLVLAGLLFQAPRDGVKPVIDNERVTVWDVTGPLPRHEHDSVSISMTPGNAVKFQKKGAVYGDKTRAIVIDLKDHSGPPMANKTGYPNAFPRPGVKKVLENDRVIVWDYTWTPGQPTPMHFHDKDVVVVYMEDGALKSTTPDGKSVVNDISVGLIRYNARDRSHTEELVKGKGRAIITEMK